MWNKKGGKKTTYRNRLTLRLIGLFLVYLAGLTALTVFARTVWRVLSAVAGYYGGRGSFFNFLTLLMTSLQTWAGSKGLTAMFFLAGMMVILLLVLRKATRYADELVAAAASLAEPGEEPIKLSGELKEAENELNLARERSLRSAMLAKEAEQRKNDLVVYLAHDLKTPLTSVIGYLTLLKDEPDLPPAQRARYTGIALDKAERLEGLINEFFDITRFNLTTLTLEKERVNLSRMLEQVASEFDPILKEKSLVWKTDIAPGVEAVCDPDKLARVFDNLLRNAVNYSYPDTEVFLSLRREGDRAVVRTQNHGRTIPPEKLDRLFEQFFRLDTSRGTATGGAGLGLAIAKEIVQAHGGVIQAESADEVIAFTVTLPL